MAVVPDAQVREPIGLSGGRLASAVRELMDDHEAGAKVLEELKVAVGWFAGFGVAELGQANKEVLKHGLMFIDRFFC